jgi:AraC-like DNA-binding protein
MIFERLVPAPPLNSFVEFLWLYDDFAPSHSKEKLLPDGSMELIIDLRDHPKHKYDRHDFSKATPYRKYWLSGMQNQFIVIEASIGSMMGVHFRAGGAWPFFGMPLSEFSDQVVELDCVLGEDAASSLRDRLLAEPTPRAKLRLLERFMLALGGDRLYPDRTVAHAVQQIMSLPMRLLIRDLASKIGISQKHLIHLFDQRVGMKPKQLDRILRFNRVIQSIAKNPKEVDWASVALDCGYYDQSHFIHDFQAFAGMTPSDYLIHNWEYSNYVVVD